MQQSEISIDASLERLKGVEAILNTLSTVSKNEQEENKNKSDVPTITKNKYYPKYLLFEKLTHHPLKKFF